MKKVFLLLIISMFLLGCAGTKESGYYEHSSLYQSWAHLKYSWYGYKHCTAEDVQKSKAEAWWGTPQESCPSQ